ncbi:MAG: DUF3368 domain-containing protein [Bacteroidota bacterium]
MTVSDASPLMNLAAVSYLSLVRDLVGPVLIPEAVYREITDGVGLPGAREVAEADWITVESVRDRTRVTLLLDRLDLGEAEAIALALQERDAGRPTRLVVYERKARAECDRLGLPRIGVVGLLLAGKMAGHLSEVRPVLNALARHGFWLRRDVTAAVLRRAGE